MRACLRALVIDGGGGTRPRARRRAPALLVETWAPPRNLWTDRRALLVTTHAHTPTRARCTRCTRCTRYNPPPKQRLGYLHEKHFVVVGDGQQAPQRLLGIVDDCLEVRAAVRKLHHRHAAPLVVEQISLRLLQHLSRPRQRPPTPPRSSGGSSRPSRRQRIEGTCTRTRTARTHTRTCVGCTCHLRQPRAGGPPWRRGPRWGGGGEC